MAAVPEVAGRVFSSSTGMVMYVKSFKQLAMGAATLVVLMGGLSSAQAGVTNFCAVS
jgi:hypothetical protein